jgi:lysyl-tRNA synthetase class 1
MSYELFLDDQGGKISKSRGNGLSTDEWLTYAPQESLALFMYKKPRTAKKLHFDVIPQHVDEYTSHARALEKQSVEERLENPLWHIHSGALSHPAQTTPAAISFSMLHNLVGACNQDDAGIIWGYIRHYAPGADPETMPWLDSMIGYAMKYYKSFIAPSRRYHTPSEKEHEALRALCDKLKTLPPDAPIDEVQTAIFDIGKENEFQPINSWFALIYQTLLGQKQGPRLGSFFVLYGIENSTALLEKALSGALIKENNQNE